MPSSTYVSRPALSSTAMGRTSSSGINNYHTSNGSNGPSRRRGNSSSITSPDPNSSAYQLYAARTELQLQQAHVAQQRERAWAAAHARLTGSASSVGSAGASSRSPPHSSSPIPLLSPSSTSAATSSGSGHRRHKSYDSAHTFFSSSSSWSGSQSHGGGGGGATRPRHNSGEGGTGGTCGAPPAAQSGRSSRARAHRSTNVYSIDSYNTLLNATMTSGTKYAAIPPESESSLLPPPLQAKQAKHLRTRTISTPCSSSSSDPRPIKPEVTGGTLNRRTTRHSRPKSVDFRTLNRSLPLRDTIQHVPEEPFHSARPTIFSSRSRTTSLPAKAHLGSSVPEADGPVYTTTHHHGRRSHRFSSPSQVGPSLASSDPPTITTESAPSQSFPGGMTMGAFVPYNSLTRLLYQPLSTPVKPLLQLGLAASVSSVAVLVLGALMSISYLLTAYDDASRRSRTLSGAATRAKTNLDSGVRWGKQILNPLHPTAPTLTGATSSWFTFVWAPWRLWYTCSFFGVRHFEQAQQSATPTDAADSKDASTAEPIDSQDKDGETRGDTSRPSSPPPPRLLTQLAWTVFMAVGAGVISLFLQRRPGPSPDTMDAHQGSVPPTASSPGPEYILRTSTSGSRPSSRVRPRTPAYV